MMMTLYILSDRELTKIGITRHYPRRIAQHKVSNPHIEEYKRYELTETDAKRFEKTVKEIFQMKRYNNSSEWFIISPQIIDIFINGLKALEETTNPPVQMRKKIMIKTAVESVGGIF